MAPTGADLDKLYGRVILFVGIEAYHWTPAQIGAAAKGARALGADTLCVKRADGSIKWYGTAENLRAERAAVLAEGVGYVPMLYSYGPQFMSRRTLPDGAVEIVGHQIQDECACLVEMGENNGGAGVLCDMEAEWNGAADMAAMFREIMRPAPIILGVTTWADPADQAWLGVAQAIAPAVNFWVPQRYDNWLSIQPLPPEETIVQPAVDLSQEFGANNVVAIVEKIASAGQSAWLWEYNFAVANPSLMRQLSGILHASGGARIMSGEEDVTSAATEPTSAPVTYEEYTVTSMDLPGGVAGLAARYGVSVEDFCAANADTIADPDVLRSNQVVRVPVSE